MSPRKSKPKNLDLPGMENRRIEPLHSKAIELEAVRSERMRLTEQEVELATEVRILMELNEKTETGYECDGVKVEYVPPDGKAKVKVKVSSAEEEPAVNSEVVETQEVQDPMVDIISGEKIEFLDDEEEASLQ